MSLEAKSSQNDMPQALERAIVTKDWQAAEDLLSLKVSAANIIVDETVPASLMGLLMQNGLDFTNNEKFLQSVVQQPDDVMLAVIKENVDVLSLKSLDCLQKVGFDVKNDLSLFDKLVEKNAVNTLYHLYCQDKSIILDPAIENVLIKLAVNNNHVEILKFFSEFYDIFSLDILNHAIQIDSDLIVDYILSNNPELIQKTSLTAALRENALRSAAVLIKHGIALEEINHAGNTALHLAVVNKNIDFATLLISHGANPLYANYDGQTPMSLAEKTHDALFIEAIKKIPTTTVHHRNVDHSQNKLIKKMLAYLEMKILPGVDVELTQYWVVSRQGLCNGLSILYAYANALSEQPQRSDEHGTPIPRDDYEWFLHQTQTLLIWDGTTPLPAEKATEVDRFLQLVRFFQNPAEITKLKLAQADINKMIGTDTTGGQLILKGVLSGIFTIGKLGEVLAELVQEHTPLIISSKLHVTAIFKKKGKFYFYDPNGKQGEIAYETPADLAKAFFKAQERSDVCDVSIHVLSYQRTQELLAATTPPALTDYSALVKRTHADIPEIKFKKEIVHGIQIAAISNDIAGVNRYLCYALDFKDKNQSKDELANLAFGAALTNATFEVAKFLLDSDFKKSIQSRMGEHLKEIMYYQNIYPLNAVEFLLEQGFDPTSSLDHHGTTILMRAVRANNRPLIDLILAQNVDINQLDDDGSNALDFARCSEDPELSNYLISKGATNPNFSSREKYQFKKNRQHEKLQQAINTHDWKLAKELLSLNFSASHIRINAATTDPELLLALMRADLDLQNNFKFIPQVVKAAIMTNNRYILERCIEFDVGFINKIDKKGNTPLTYAIKHNNQDFVVLFLKMGADLKLAESAIKKMGMCLTQSDVHESQMSPFIHAAAYLENTTNAKRFVSCLLKRGYSVDEPDHEGKTLLYLAVQDKNIRLVKYLLSRNANPHLSNHQGQSPLALAKQTQDQALIDAFKTMPKLTTKFFSSEQEKLTQRNTTASTSRVDPHQKLS